MKYHRSPYEINAEINGLIQSLEMNFDVSVERKIIDLLNRIDAYPDMSHYQLSLTKKALGDCYFSHNITGNAMDMYEWALEDYAGLPIKRRLASLQKSPTDSLIYSLDVHTVSDNGILFHERSIREYGQEHEADAETALDRLGVSYKNEFYRLRGIQEFYESLPEDEQFLPDSRTHKNLPEYVQKIMDEADREYEEPNNWDARLLKDMAKSKHFEDIHEEALASVRNFHPAETNDSAALPMPYPGELAENELHFLKYIHHKPVSLPYIPGYFTHDFHLDYCRVLQSGFMHGLIGYAPAAYALGKKTVAELKDILRDAGCPISGKKSDLVAAILENTGGSSFSSEYYELTESGKSLILKSFPDSVFY